MLEEAVDRWARVAENTRPGRERELAAVETRIRKTQDALDRYFAAFEEGRLSEEACTRRIEELSAKLTALEARRSDLAEEVSRRRPEVPGPPRLAEVGREVQRALRKAAMAERKAMMQAIVAEIRVRDRDHIQPVFRVPVFRPPYGPVGRAGLEPATLGLRVPCSGQLS
jgi:site-specific DNA recombinase